MTSKYLNSARPKKEEPAPIPDPSLREAHKTTPAEEYDLNFKDGDVIPRSSNRVELRPFIVSHQPRNPPGISRSTDSQKPSIYAQTLADHVHDIPDIDELLRSPMDDVGDVLSWAEKSVRRNPVSHSIASSMLLCRTLTLVSLMLRMDASLLHLPTPLSYPKRSLTKLQSISTTPQLDLRRRTTCSLA